MQTDTQTFCGVRFIYDSCSDGWCTGNGAIGVCRHGCLWYADAVSGTGNTPCWLHKKGTPIPPNCRPTDSVAAVRDRLAAMRDWRTGLPCYANKRLARALVALSKFVSGGKP
jgi:hypothetical protein